MDGFCRKEENWWRKGRWQGSYIAGSTTATRTACYCDRTLTTDPAADYRDQSSSMEGRREAISKVDHGYGFPLVKKKVHGGPTFPRASYHLGHSRAVALTSHWCSLYLHVIDDWALGPEVASIDHPLGLHSDPWERRWCWYCCLDANPLERNKSGLKPHGSTLHGSDSWAE